ncbi:helix-turn-helix transcriptional regulator [Natronosporangium hydrolyticum]|uniref:Helix-turn-helix transcriptional regulator n=1 Tax=Natronosporangium hydrolyticum TaxID=2811111 RepID=A0A895YD44_9ACTN|nr:helix-turn-helix domain-containing protein [Natronosporangium hydrolyticum]QSB13289.1 helix-turn-helix transcriptional regulator [Natronosporangium hydrolyticum]
MEELPIGRRVAYWRNRRRMSQQVFADRLGKSKSWVDKVERGVRRLDKFSLIHDIADVLQVETKLLLGSEPDRRDDRREETHLIARSEVVEIRAALERYDQVNLFYPPPTPPPALSELGKSVRHAWLTYQHAKGQTLARLLPDLLRQAQTADLFYQRTDQAARAAHLLGQVYQIASSSLRNLGEFELAWLAADRAVAVAQRAKDELLAGVATFRVGMALLAMGRARPALEINISVANRLAPPYGRDSTPQQLSVYGMLLLQGAMAAAKIRDGSTASDLLRAADEAAQWLGADHNHYWSCFGPTNVLLHRAAAAVEMGEGKYAVATHEQIGADGFAALVPERRVHFLLDLARGWAQVGDVQRAGEMLVAGDRLAPAELRSRPIVREILGDVMRRSQGTPPPAVCELAAQTGVGG